MAGLALQNIVKTFANGIRAVDDLSLDVADGERIVLTGPSGSGKSTTLRLIAGLENLTSGTISIDGRIVDNLPPQKRDVSMVFQQHALYPHLNVYGNLAFALKLRRMPKNEIEQRICETAAMLGIAHLLHRKTWELSGGQRQRVSLGRAIVRQPKIFLFDEPLTHLDAGLRQQMRHEIARLHEERLHSAMIYVTHDQTEAMTLAHRIVVLNEGQVQQIADPGTIYNKPANRFVASFIGSPGMNFFPGRIKLLDGSLTFQSDDEKNIRWPLSPRWKAALQSHLHQKIVLGVRPEHISLEQSSNKNTLKIPATVESSESLGAQSLVYLRTATVKFICCIQSKLIPSSADCVCPSVDESHLHFFTGEDGKSVS